MGFLAIDQVGAKIDEAAFKLKENIKTDLQKGLTTPVEEDEG